MLEEMKKLIREKDVCVLATAAGGKPHCSLMAYVIDDDCREIYMTTYRKTKKFQNLIQNPSVSLLIDTREEHSGPRRSEAKAMTVDAVYSRIDNEGKRAMVQSKLLVKHPHLKTFLDHPDAEILCLKISSFLMLNGLTDAHYEELPPS